MPQDLEHDDKAGEIASPDSEVPFALQSLARKGLISQRGNEFYAILGATEVRTWVDECFDFDDCAGLQPLTEYMAETDMFSTAADNTSPPRASNNAGSVCATMEPALSVPISGVPGEQQSDWTEATMSKALEEAQATKEFPPYIKKGSEFHTEFLYRHFTRLSPAEMKEHAQKESWKAVYSQSSRCPQ